MKSTGEMSCQLKGMAEKTTVGDLFELYCKWDNSVHRLSMPVQMELSQINKPYALVILKEDSFMPGEASFTVTSYQPGLYNTKIKLTGQNNQLESNPLKWQVHSVIPKEKQGTIKPHPPYGPWLYPLPVWYWPSLIIFVGAFLVMAGCKIHTGLKKRKHIQKVNNRLKSKSALREFISRITLLTRQLHELSKEQVICKIREYFSLFLEDQFFIFAVNTTHQKIIKQMKRYCSLVNPEQRKSILMFYAELDKNLSIKKEIRLQDCEQLIDLSRKIVIQLYESRES